jgi:hypothetical protein
MGYEHAISVRAKPLGNIHALRLRLTDPGILYVLYALDAGKAG